MRHIVLLAMLTAIATHGLPTEEDSNNNNQQQQAEENNQQQQDKDDDNNLSQQVKELVSNNNTLIAFGERFFASPIVKLATNPKVMALRQAVAQWIQGNPGVRPGTYRTFGIDPFYILGNWARPMLWEYATGTGTDLENSRKAQTVLSGDFPREVYMDMLLELFDASVMYYIRMSFTNTFLDWFGVEVCHAPTDWMFGFLHPFTDSYHVPEASTRTMNRLYQKVYKPVVREVARDHSHRHLWVKAQNDDATADKPIDLDMDTKTTTNMHKPPTDDDQQPEAVEVLLELSKDTESQEPSVVVPVGSGMAERNRAHSNKGQDWGDHRSGLKLFCEKYGWLRVVVLFGLMIYKLSLLMDISLVVCVLLAPLFKLLQSDSLGASAFHTCAMPLLDWPFPI